jgi:IS5 family transposase
MHAAIRGLNRLARKHGVRLRQSYLRVAGNAAMMAGRYAHAKQFKRRNRQLRLPHAPGSVGSSATSAAGSEAMRRWRRPQPALVLKWLRKIFAFIVAILMAIALSQTEHKAAS